MEGEGAASIADRNNGLDTASDHRVLEWPLGGSTVGTCSYTGQVGSWARSEVHSRLGGGA